MALYSYYGSVFEFDREVARWWKGRTYATSEAKARCNLAYQFKIETGRVPRTKITLPGKITIEGVDNYGRSGIYPELAQVQRGAEEYRL